MAICIGLQLSIMSVAMLSQINSARADLLAGWNFNNSTAGAGGAAGVFNATGTVEVYNASNKTLSPASYGAVASSSTVDFNGLAGAMGGAANNNWGTFTGDVTNQINTSDAAGGALAVIGSGNNGKYATFKTSTIGYSDVVLSYATRGTATGFNTQSWAYSTDGTNYTQFSDITGRNVTSWSTQTVDFSSIDALDNQSDVYFRLSYSGATSTSGNNRLDNVQFNATAIPEPCTLIVLAMGGLCLLPVMRRK